MIRRTASLALLMALALCGMALAQAQNGTISIAVVDADGAALPGVSIEASSDQTLSRRTAVTDGNGSTQLLALVPATNYVVVAQLDGFSTARVETVSVRAGQKNSLLIELRIAEVSEELVVTAEAPLVDVTKTQAGQDITLRLTESLPTARSYQDYLQLVPGVQDAIGTTDNPASRSGINYRDLDGGEGDVGRSSDNLYYFDGINVTDRTAGTNGANLNTEIIQEQSVITGAIPAEFVGVPGLVSNVVTKSGGNQFSGSVNFYIQNDSLVESNDNFADDSFSTSDAAFTLGGPIVRDKAWFFTSFRQLEEQRDVVNEDGEFLRSPTLDQDQAFGKVTWAISDSDVLSGTFLTDPQEQDGSFRREVPNSAINIDDEGGERFSIGYNRVWGAAALELAATDHDADLNATPLDQSNRNDIGFAPGIERTSGEERLGGGGTNFIENRSTESVRASLEYLFDTSWGDHALKFGVVDGESALFEDDETSGNPPAIFTSLNPRGTDGVISLGEIVNGWSEQEFGISSDELVNFNENLTASQRDTLLGLWDDNGNGFLDQGELEANMFFSTTAGNPNGLINYARDLEIARGPSNKSSESTHYFLQDSWQWNKWSVNAGVRGEDTTFIDDLGNDVGTWDAEVAPRVSISYDLKGDGRSSLGLFFGEYYDAFRDSAIDFAGSRNGRIVEEQVFVDALGEWVNFRTRGGPGVRDAFFAPSIDTPVTEELQLQYKQDLGNNMMFEINLIDRETTGIGEDYGSLYYDPEEYAAFGDPNAPGSFFLGAEFFGFDSFEDIPTDLNFLVGSLPDGNFRDWQGLELIFRKRYSDNWQLLASYNYADADGNTNSDGNFDGAGDVIFLDPRAPNRTGIQPGLVENLFKVHGSYNWDNGFQLGGSYRWNSGPILNRNGGQAFGRSLPDRVETAFEAGGVTDNFIAPDAIGFIDGSSYGVLDVRASYLWTLNDRTELDFFADIFNILDEQDVIIVQDLVTGGDGFNFLEGTDFVQPRRYFLGARLRF